MPLSVPITPGLRVRMDIDPEHLLEVVSIGSVGCQLYRIDQDGKKYQWLTVTRSSLMLHFSLVSPDGSSIYTREGPVQAPQRQS